VNPCSGEARSGSFDRPEYRAVGFARSAERLSKRGIDRIVNAVVGNHGSKAPDDLPFLTTLSDEFAKLEKRQRKIRWSPSSL
jgi:hypothetical protein